MSLSNAAEETSKAGQHHRAAIIAGNNANLQANVHGRGSAAHKVAVKQARAKENKFLSTVKDKARSRANIRSIHGGL